MKFAKLTVLLISLVVVAAACGGDSRTATVPTEPRLMLLVDARGPGLYHPFDLLQPLVPRLALYSDGMLVMVEQSDEVHATYRAARVRTEDLADVMAAASEAGLAGPDRDLGFSGVADSVTARITVAHDNGTHTTIADGFWDGVGDQYTPAERSARQAALDFLSQLTDPDMWWLVDETDDYVPDTWAALWSNVVDVAELPFAAVTEPWPLDGDPRTSGTVVSAGDGARCVVTSGPRAADLLTALRPGTIWEHDGDTFYLYLRPLLRHEATDCASASQ